jgi:hypothetical protein
LKLVGQKRVEAPQLISEAVMQEEDAGVLAAEIVTGLKDCEIRLSSSELIKRKTLFKTYTPFTVRFYSLSLISCSL